MEYICDDCCEQSPVWTWETVGRGWKFLCAECYEYATPILQSFCVPFVAGQYYPTFDYDTRTIR